MTPTDCQDKSLTVHIQMILDAGPATLSKEEAWKYMLHELIEIREGRAGLEKIPVLIAVAQLWNTHHQREIVTVLHRIGRRLKRQEARFQIFADAARAGVRAK